MNNNFYLSRPSRFWMEVNENGTQHLSLIISVTAEVQVHDEGFRSIDELLTSSKKKDNRVNIVFG